VDDGREQKMRHFPREVPQTEENHLCAFYETSVPLLAEGGVGDGPAGGLLADGELDGGVKIVECGVGLADTGGRGLGVVRGGGVPEGRDAAGLEVLDAPVGGEGGGCLGLEEGHLGEGTAGEETGEDAGDPQGSYLEQTPGGTAGGCGGAEGPGVTRETGGGHRVRLRVRNLFKTKDFRALRWPKSNFGDSPRQLPDGGRWVIGVRRGDCVGDAAGWEALQAIER